jgi:tetratricopeptide (TPR) repeat protein
LLPDHDIPSLTNAVLTDTALPDAVTHPNNGNFQHLPVAASLPVDADLIEPQTILLAGPEVSSSSAPILWKALIPICILAPLCALALWLDQSPPGSLPPTPQTSIVRPSATNAPHSPLPDLLGAPQGNTGQQAPGALGGATPTAPLSSPQSGQGALPSIALATPPMAAPVAAPTALADSPGRAAFLMGEEALRRQKPDEAKRAYQEALHLDANLAPAHMRLADFAARGNDARETQYHLESAARLLPNDATPHLQLSQLFLQTHQAQKAEAAALNAVQIAKGPIKRAAQGNYARILTGNKKEAQAFGVWTSLLKSNPGDVEAALSASLLAGRKLNKPQEAKTLMAQAIKVPPTNPDVTLFLAGVLAEQKRVDDATKVLVAGTRKFPQFIPLHISLAELRLARGDNKGALATLRALLPRVPKTVTGGRTKAEVHIALAQALAHSRQVKPALAEAKNALQLQPRNPAVIAAVAELHFATGDSKSGIGALRNLLRLDPKNSQARHALAEALASTNQWDAAQKELQTYIKAVPKDLNALAEMAALHERRGKREAALQVWNSIAQKRPDHPLAPLQQGRLLALLNRPEKALERYRAVLKLAPNEPNALMGAAEIEEKRGEEGAALDYLKAFINVEPKFDPAYAMLMRVAKKQNQEDKTIDFLKQQLTQNPDRRGAYAAILDYYETVGKGESGRAFVKSYIDKNPKLTAPRLAIEEFDLRRAKASLSELLKADKTKADKPVADKSDADKADSDKPLLRERGSTLPLPKD